MNFDEAREVFLQQNKNGWDVLIVRLSKGGDASNPNTKFDVVDRVSSFGKIYESQ